MISMCVGIWPRIFWPRVSEYTAPEKWQENRCVKVGDLVFGAIGEEGEVKIRGGNLLTFYREGDAQVLRMLDKTIDAVNGSYSWSQIYRTAINRGKPDPGGPSWVDEAIYSQRWGQIIHKVYCGEQQENNQKWADNQNDSRRNKRFLYTRGFRPKLLLILFSRKRSDNTHDVFMSTRDGFQG